MVLAERSEWLATLLRISTVDTAVAFGAERFEACPKFTTEQIARRIFKVCRGKSIETAPPTSGLRMPYPVRSPDLTIGNVNHAREV